MPGLASVITAAGMAYGVIQSLLYTNPSFVTARARQTYRQNPTMLPDLSLLVAMKLKGSIDQGAFTSLARQAGFDDGLANGAVTAAEQLLGASDYVTLWRRGKIDEGQMDSELKRAGFSDESIKGIKEASEYFPPPQDLIRFAVREVYNSGVRSQFGMDEDISDEFIEEAYKAGVPEEQARNYWASHWQLPSVQMGFEMLHRRVISESELAALLKAQDVMPFWREALTKISYNPLTRVDVRRMHAMGLIGDAELKDRYMDIGFSSENADMMVRFTKAYNSREEAGLSQGKILEAYRKGVVSQSTAGSLLRDIGISSQAISVLLETAEFDRVMSEADDYKADLFQQYQAGVLTAEQVRARLNSLGTPETYVSAAMAELDRKASAKIKLPSKTDLTDWFRLGIISEETYKQRMEEIGYREPDVLAYLTEIEIERETDEVRYLSDTVYLRWVKKEMITPDQFRAIMDNKGTRLQDTESLLAEVLEG